jgi:hypothetical protein
MEARVSESAVSVRNLKTDRLSDVTRLYFHCWGTRILLIQLIACLGIRIALGGVSVLDAGIVVGVLLWWPFQECCAHLYILHAKPRKIGSYTFDSKAARIHRHHHQYPFDLKAIFVPVDVILLLIPFHAAAWILLMPTWEMAFTAIFIYTLTTMIYEWVHLFCHVSYRPKTQYFQKVQNYHRAHHFKNEQYWFAFSIPWVDRVFGTGPDIKSTPRSTTTKTLGIGIEGK